MGKMQSKGGNDTHSEKRSDDSVKLNLKEDSTMLSCFTLPIVGTDSPPTKYGPNTELHTLSLSDWESNPVWVWINWSAS